MPVYTYQIINEDGSDGEVFEVLRRMSDPPLTRHPETGQPVKRIYQPVNIATKWTDRHTKQNLSDSNLEKHGFTKYVRQGKGQYERTAGSGGPDHISAGD